MPDISVHTRLKALAALARSIGLSLLLLVAAAPAIGAGVNLAWDAVAEPSGGRLQDPLRALRR